MLVFNEIMTPFPWYDNPLKQNRNKANCASQCDYKLISPKNAVLPFMLKKPKTGNATSWRIYNAHKNEQYELTGMLPYVKKRAIEGADYIYYDGRALTLPGNNGGPAVPLSLPYGFYYSMILFEAGPPMVSELFFIPENSFNVGADSQYLKLEWYNSYDLRPFYYSDKTADIPYFINTLYLDTFITTRDPDVSVDTKKDGDDNAVPVFQKVSITHIIHSFLPDFLKLALACMAIHDNVKIKTAGGIYVGDIKNINIEASTEAPGCMSTVTLKFDQDLAIVNRSCSDGMVLDV